MSAVTVTTERPTERAARLHVLAEYRAERKHRSMYEAMTEVAHRNATDYMLGVKFCLPPDDATQASDFARWEAAREYGTKILDRYRARSLVGGRVTS